VHIYNTYKNTGTKEELLFSFFWHYKKQGIRAKKRVNYYPHGPLARVEYGNYDNKVQGMDYAYTLQGWVKGINSNTLNKTRDIGQDGLVGGTYQANNSDIHASIAKDAFGYSLNYFKGDYQPIQNLRWSTVTDRFEAVTVGSDLESSTHDLFNGNIKAMVTSIVKPTVHTDNTLEYTPLPQGTAYKYDQLNRLMSMEAWQNLNTTTNVWGAGLAYTGMYENKFTYDANGSILTALAKNQAGQTIDNQTYNHQFINGHKFSNRTYSINDAATQTSGNDLLDQVAFNNTATTINTANNYSYTETGERKSDKQNDIDLITWSVYGKIKSVTRSTGSTKDNLKFDYDASGNRIAKHVYDASNNWIRTEYNIRDAQGNIMSTYEYKPAAGNTMSFVQTEKQIYGSSLLGIDVTKTELVGALSPANPYSHTLGNKHFTGNNHLGNVLVTFTDRKLPISNNGTTISEYWPDVIASNDYAPFGGLLTERTFNQNTFPNSFNGKRDDEEIGMQNYGMRMYAEREFISVDPLFRSYPHYSAYQFAGNDVIRNTDLDGLEPNSAIINKNNNNYSYIIIPASDRIHHQVPADAKYFFNPEGSASSGRDRVGQEYGVALTFVSFALPVARIVTMIKTVETASEARLLWRAAEIYIYTAPAIYQATNNTFGDGSVEYSTLPGQMTESPIVDAAFVALPLVQGLKIKTVGEVIDEADNAKTMFEDYQKATEFKTPEPPKQQITTTTTAKTATSKTTGNTATKTGSSTSANLVHKQTSFTDDVAGLSK
jgi:RHS repeat-associated protein